MSNDHDKRRYWLGFNDKQSVIKGSTIKNLSKNVTHEVYSDYEHYMRTFIYKVSARAQVDDDFLRPVSHMGSEVKNYKTMYSGYNKQPAPRYSNLNRLMVKVFPKDVMTNNFFASVNKSGYNNSLIKKGIHYEKSISSITNFIMQYFC